MTLLAPHLAAFLQERLPHEREASAHTCDTYAYAYQLLLTFAAARLHVAPSGINVEQVDAALVLAFLKHLEKDRGNSARTRNARLAAIKSFAHFLEHRIPGHIEEIRRILSIPNKKCDERLVAYLDRNQIQALLDAPTPTSRWGVRDRAMLHLTFAAGLRVSELVGLRLDEVILQPCPSIHVRGKGRRERRLPLWKETAKALRAWLAVRGQAACPELFLNARQQPLSRSGFEYILAKHVNAAKRHQPAIGNKRVSPHVLRHSCAIHTLDATHDIRKVALWLGHSSVKTTEIYLRTAPDEKLDAIESMVPPSLRKGRFRPPDKLLAMLKPSRKGP